MFSFMAPLAWCKFKAGCDALGAWGEGGLIFPCCRATLVCQLCSWFLEDWCKGGRAHEILHFRPHARKQTCARALQKVACRFCMGLLAWSNFKAGMPRCHFVMCDTGVPVPFLEWLTWLADAVQRWGAQACLGRVNSPAVSTELHMHMHTAGAGAPQLRRGAAGLQRGLRVAAQGKRVVALCVVGCAGALQ